MAMTSFGHKGYLTFELGSRGLGGLLMGIGLAIALAVSIAFMLMALDRLVGE
jgi:hypothetical protein